MRRKSERNKAKGSPEKKVEKPTRKSTRRRGRKSASSSPDRDNTEDSSTSSIPRAKENDTVPVIEEKCPVKELETIVEVPQDADPIVSFMEVEETGKPLEEEDAGSVWKVARADASPGEIQKLKLCRQRNISEASDNSLSRKKSNKWPESGEVVGEEADSADEQPTPSKKVAGSTGLNDPSSLHLGQDSNEEVSDSKEILPKTASADLSDDKPNIDQQPDSKEASCSIQNADDEKSPKSSGTTVAPSSNGAESKELIVREEKTTEDEEVTNADVKMDYIPKESSSEEEKDEQSDSSSNSAAGSSAHSNSGVKTSSRASRRKHRNKYRESSNSDTGESEDEPSVAKKVQELYFEENKPEEKESSTNRNEFPLPEPRSNSVQENNIEMEIEQHESNKETLNIINDKPEHDLLTSNLILNQKPAKVNLKRSFTTRLSADLTDVTKEEMTAKLDSEHVQNKENITNTEQSEGKCIMRKRRWGTALPTDVTPAFSVSTESLKVLVPGAKPLSINEVRLSKDDDEERDQRKDREKSRLSGDSVGEYKPKDEGILQKNEATRRKISIVKDAPHVKSPSPPAIKPTNILLIKNLVRPFTLNQIKELLSRTGTIVENGFWMDRIKSKCFVEYSNEDQAFETRQALHGISWPISNPKRLQVEYATKDDMELARELSKDQPIPRKTEPLLPSDPWHHDWARDERTNSAPKVTIVREWDLGKEDGPLHVKEKEREKKEMDKKRRQRSRSPLLEAHLPAPARKFKKKEDDPPPAKLLDDLFRKTKAVPCIYWLPLTNEQIVVKEEMRRQHMAEHARRLEEMRRAERNRDGRRRRSPRK
ncbi:apoptotic chromatin condensation inducer in the nucleus [Orussus abietinus]|uniref:apoptotic chromatin condensation inducer in the nucleus n=1 Tax=Orussus abietinus TaxID=222816 RepID=UPI00062604B5|nr:apoptotic chromatin condensation inducer in the nucleus [Orussus abietinus]